MLLVIGSSMEGNNRMFDTGGGFFETGSVSISVPKKEVEIRMIPEIKPWNSNYYNAKKIDPIKTTRSLGRGQDLINLPRSLFEIDTMGSNIFSIAQRESNQYLDLEANVCEQ
jgi:hypothetical protein